MIGILQGRLTPPWNGKLQCFPKDNWQGEFAAARAAGFDALELIVETEYNPDNPVWSVGGRDRLRALSQQHKIHIETLCADSFMTTTFVHEPKESAELLQKLASFGFRRIVLPFFEKAEIHGTSEMGKIVHVLSQVDVGPVELALETTLPGAKLKPFLDSLGLPVCYDLGNTTALGHDIAADIKVLGERITHVHIKDKRKADGQNVILGTGDTDFTGAFAALRDIGYRGDLTCETNRGDDPLVAAQQHAQFVRERWKA